ncbi:Na+/H+ exchanger protein [Cyclospora cayetanensis]|uniref:Na+/H+ exchanger protein n=1 Tax=Cyclospora cayetanensis TaxID=88456 RepID=A0A1D3CRN0_9EIME|nr:Na+/H+ exchanger protein [Cyclospora cayetanensis]
MQGTLEERTFAALSSFLDHGSSGFLATTRRCLCDASPSSRTASASSEGHTPKRRPEHPPTHSLYPVFALCVLAALCAIWRHSNVGALVSSAPAFGIFRSTDRGGASHFEGSLPLGNAASALHSADVKQSRIFGPSGLASSAPHYSAGEPSVRRLSEDEQIETPTGSIPIAPSLAFFSFLFFFAIFLQWLVSKIPVYPPPVSIVWFVFGMAAYGVASIPALLPQQPWEKPGGSAATPGASFQAPIRGHNILQTAILEMRFIDSSIVYYVMMPILLYEATQNINWHKFKKFLAGGLTLAVLGVALQVGILGVLFYYTFIGNQWADRAWTAAFLLAATLSSTDPVAVLSVLNAVNASDKLCTMFDGESLINDGSAVLLFQFFFFLLQGVAETPFSTFIMFVKLLFLGPAFGIAVGLVAYAWLLFFRRHPLMQCLAYITFCYVSYFLAEAVFSLSGPLTAVCYGLFIKAYGHIALDRDAQTKHHTFVAALALMANCTIFIVSGIVTYGMMSSVFTRDDGLTYWLHLLVTYLYLNAARIFMIIFFVPILRRTGYGLSWKEVGNRVA